MRLAQIARKLNTTPNVIIKFIEQNFEVKIPSAPNTKIPDEYVPRILQYFSPDTTEDHVAKPEETIPINDDLESKEVREETTHSAEENITIINKEDETNETDSVKEEAPEEVEEVKDLNIEDGVIKAPKVKVHGIKVIDKIELPSKPQKESVEIEVKDNIEDATEDNASKEQSKPKSQKKEKHKPSPKKSNSLSYQEEIQKIQNEYEKELKKRQEKEKQKKKANYERLMRERVKAKQKNDSNENRTKVNLKKDSDQTTVIEQTRKESKTTWGKFIKWLNS